MTEQQLLWGTRDGRRINPSDMKTDHIKNALALLKRQGFIGPSTVSFYVAGPRPIGEMAQDCFDCEYEAVLDAPVSRFVDIFEAILEERQGETDERGYSQGAWPDAGVL